jgi:hypothetical protein
MLLKAQSLLISNESGEGQMKLSWKGLTALLVFSVCGHGLDSALRPDPSGDLAWAYGSSSLHFPLLEEAASSFWRSRGRQLDLSYPEVASLLRQRMPRRTPTATLRSLSAQILRLCTELDFQPSFVLAVIEHESAFKPRALSNRGAVGLMQLLPATALEVARKIGLKTRKGWLDLRDPVTNVTLGMHYLAQLQRQFRTLESTLAAYNLGPGRWAELQKNPKRIRPGQTLRYVALIQRTRERIKIDGREAWAPDLAARLGAGAWL